MARLIALVTLVVSMLARPVDASPLSFPRRLVFVGNPGTPRTKSFVELLGRRSGDAGGRKTSLISSSAIVAAIGGTSTHWLKRVRSRRLSCVAPPARMRRK